MFDLYYYYLTENGQGLCIVVSKYLKLQLTRGDRFIEVKCNKISQIGTLSSNHMCFIEVVT